MDLAQLLELLARFDALDEAERTSVNEALAALDLSALDDSEIDSLEGALMAAFDAADDETAPDVATMETIHGHVLATRTEQDARAAADEEARAAADALRATIHPVADGDEGDDDEGEEEPAGDEGEPAGDGEGDGEEEGAAGEEPAAVAASAARRRTGVVAAAARNQHRSRTPRPANDGPSGSRLTLVASGQDISDLDERERSRQLGQAFRDRMGAFTGRHTGSTELVRVARVGWEYPEDRRLTGNPEHDSVVLQRLFATAGRSTPEALTAAGGICAPATPMYDQPFLATDVRPVRDGLPSTQAPRGGITFVPAPQFTDADLGDGETWSDGVTVHTVADDVAGTAKNVLTLVCGDAETVRVQAIVKRLRFGNFNAEFFPELTDNFIGQLDAAHAQTGEVELLDAIAAASTDVTTAQQVGAARDVLVNVELASVAYRDRHRMGRTATLDIYLPSWVHGALRSDLALGLDGTLDKLSVADAMIDQFFTARNLRVVWYIDSATGAGQNFGAQAAGALNDWPSEIRGYLHPPGTFLHLDGGSLDLGLVRDSTLNATNDAEFFAETFEAVAHLGHEAVELQMSVCVNGAVAGTIDPATLCAGS